MFGSLRPCTCIVGISRRVETLPLRELPLNVVGNSTSGPLLRLRLAVNRFELDPMRLTLPSKLQKLKIEISATAVLTSVYMSVLL